MSLISRIRKRYNEGVSKKKPLREGIPVRADSRTEEPASNRLRTIALTN